MKYRIENTGVFGKFKIKIDYNVTHDDDKSRRNISRENSLLLCKQQGQIDGLFVAEAYRSVKNPATNFIFPKDIGKPSIKQNRQQTTVSAMSKKVFRLEFDNLMSMLVISHKKCNLLLKAFCFSEEQIGHGLFTKRPIPRNIYVAEYFGEISNYQLSNYSLKIKENLYIDAEENEKCIARYANCEQNNPNLKMVSENKRYFLYSVREGFKSKK